MSLRLHSQGYQLSCEGSAFLSLLTLTNIPYVKRHWELAKEGENVLKHRALMVLDAIPIVGICVSILERIIAYLTENLKNTNSPSLTNKNPQQLPSTLINPPSSSPHNSQSASSSPNSNNLPIPTQSSSNPFSNLANNTQSKVENIASKTSSNTFNSNAPAFISISQSNPVLNISDSNDPHLLKKQKQRFSEVLEKFGSEKNLDLLLGQHLREEVHDYGTLLQDRSLSEVLTQFLKYLSSEVLTQFLKYSCDNELECEIANEALPGGTIYNLLPQSITETEEEKLKNETKIMAALERIFILRDSTGKILEAFQESGLWIATPGHQIREQIRGQIREFIIRGGEFRIVRHEDKNARIRVSKQDKLMVGCNSGQNYSQVMRLVLANHGLTVHSQVLAGNDSLVNPNLTWLKRIEHTSQENEAFFQAFGENKATRFMGEQFNDLVGAESYKWLKDLSCFGKDLDQQFNQLDVDHFICFEKAAPSVLIRLLEREGSLEGIKITYVKYRDSVKYPEPEGGIKSGSLEAYSDFAQVMESKLLIE